MKLSTAEDIQSRTSPVKDKLRQSRTSPVKDKLRLPGNWTRKALVDMLVQKLSTDLSDGDHGLLGMEEARKEAKRIEMESFAIADKYSKKLNDDGISVTSLYTDHALKMKSDLQKTIPRGNVKFKGLGNKLLLLPDTSFDRRPTCDISSLEEFKTKPLFCPLTGLERSKKRTCLSNRNFGTADETAAAPICLKEPDLRDNLFAVDAGLAHSETIGNLPDPVFAVDAGLAHSETIGNLLDPVFAVDAGLAHSETIGNLPDPVRCYNNNLNLESTGTMTIESAIPMPRNEIADKTALAFGECLTKLKLPKKLSETENDFDDGAALVSAKTSEPSGLDQQELHVNTDMLQIVGARYPKHAFMNEAGFVQPTLKMSNERLSELKKILKDGTNLQAMLGLLVDDKLEGEARVSVEKVEDEPEGEARVNGEEEGDAMNVDGGLDSYLQNL